MPYKNPEKQRQAVRKAMKKWRLKERNRLAFLESEVDRLQNSLTHVLMHKIEAKELVLGNLQYIPDKTLRRN